MHFRRNNHQIWWGNLLRITYWKLSFYLTNTTLMDKTTLLWRKMVPNPIWYAFFCQVGSRYLGVPRTILRNEIAINQQLLIFDPLIMSQIVLGKHKTFFALFAFSTFCVCTKNYVGTCQNAFWLYQNWLRNEVFQYHPKVYHISH